MVCDREAAEREEEDEDEERDTESKTRTPHKDVGNNFSKNKTTRNNSNNKK